jgi:hypothetical protein
MRNMHHMMSVEYALLSTVLTMKQSGPMQVDRSLGNMQCHLLNLLLSPLLCAAAEKRTWWTLPSSCGSWLRL